MSLTSRSIVTLNEVKSYLKMSTGALDIDTVIEDFIDIVSGRFESETNNKCVTQEVEEILDGPWDDTLITTYFPVESLSGDSESERLANLQYRDAAGEAWQNLADDEDYVFIPGQDAVGIQLLSPACYMPGIKNTRVKYICGVAREDVPADIRKIVVEGVAVMWKESNQGEGRIGLSSQSGTVSGGTTAFDDFEKRWNAVVSRHRKLI